MPIETAPGTSLKYYLITFDKNGKEYDEAGERLSQQILDVLAHEPITDVFLFSHGWMGDIPAARKQYNNWVKAMAANQTDIERMQQARPGFRPLLIGLHWPSLPYGNEELGSNPISFDAADSPVEQWIEQYADRIADTPAARQALRTIFNAALEDIAPTTLPPEVSQAYTVLDQEAALGCDRIAGAPGHDREPFDPESIFQNAETEAASFGGFDGDLLLAPLRTLSFWKMKDRARQFGETGGFQLLERLQMATSDSVHFHLMGHSFGCIVVSATLAGPFGRGPLVRPVQSLALVQGALSLWSYCSDIPVLPGHAGYFRSLITNHKVTGPILTTQSEYDTAVGKLYPLAAGVRQQIVYDPGELPKYGGLGAFGACGPGLDIVSMNMLPKDIPYQFEAGKIYNLESSQYICDTSQGGAAAGAHSDIAKPEVAHAVWSAAVHQSLQVASNSN
jgi:hypothetical protein